MCNPAAIQVVALVASTAVQVQGQRAQGEYQEGVAKYNARVAENEADAVRAAGNEQENIHRERVAQLLARQRAQLGAANVELTSGSPLQLQEDTLALGEADALRIRSNTQRQAAALETGAALTRSGGAAARQAGRTAAAGTLLSGAGEFAGSGVADKWFSPDSAAKQTSLGVT